MCLRCVIKGRCFPLAGTSLAVLVPWDINIWPRGSVFIDGHGPLGETTGEDVFCSSSCLPPPGGSGRSSAIPARPSEAAPEGLGTARFS
jgi:hypothetical protein